MNTDTGHLVDLLKEPGYVGLPGYEPLPPELHHAARRKLAGKSETHVSLTSGGKLSRHAAARRKARRKMAKASRRQNRS